VKQRRLQPGREVSPPLATAVKISRSSRIDGQIRAAEASLAREMWFAKIEREIIARGISASVSDLARKLHRFNTLPIGWASILNPPVVTLPLHITVAGKLHSVSSACCRTEVNYLHDLPSKA